MVTNYLNPIGGVVGNDVSMFNGGINAYVNKAFLESEQLPYCMNMTMENPPEVKTRQGRTTMAEYLLNKTWNGSIGTPIDLWAYNEYQFYVIVDDGGIRKVIEIYRPYYDSHYESAYKIRELGSIPKENNYYFTLAQNATSQWLYITGLTFKRKILIDNNPLQTEMEVIEDGHYGISCCHKGRLFLGMPDSNIITYSALFDFDNFAEMQQYQVITDLLNAVDTSIVYLIEDSENTARWYTYEWNEDESQWENTGTMAKTELIIDTTTGLSIPDYSVIAGDFKVTNSIGDLVSLKSYDDKLMIFCSHSMHCMYGTTPDMSLSEHYQLVDLNNNLGAISDKCIAIGGGRLYWLGDNNEVYEYTGSSMNMISRPCETRYSTLSKGGISGLINPEDIYKGQAVDTGYSSSKFVATSERLYINTWNAKRTGEKLLFVFDLYNRIWWCEDGEFTTIGNFSFERNEILLALENGDILRNTSTFVPSLSNNFDKVDTLWDFGKGEKKTKSIEYEINTRVYGVDGVDLRKTLNDVWFQARANADVYINDIWTSLDRWANLISTDYNLVKIGSLEYTYQSPTQGTYYRPDKYEQQVCYVEKMYGQRLNAFQIIIKGKGESRFFLMKREWRAR